jgi:hypothetical protein
VFDGLGRTGVGRMTDKTIRMDLTEHQFNLIWNVLNEYEPREEIDIRVCNQTLDEMENIVEKLIGETK